MSIHLGSVSASEVTTLQRYTNLFIIIIIIKVHSPCSTLYIAAAVEINTTVSGVIQTRILSHCSQMR